MKNKINAFLFSVKSSISNKPMALLLLMLIIIMTIVITGSFSKIFIADAEYQIYKTAKIEVNSKKTMDFLKYGEAIKSLSESGFITTDMGFQWYLRSTGTTIENTTNNNIKKGSVTIEYVLFENEFFKGDLLASGKGGAVINNKLAEILGAKIGDKIKINGDDANNYEILNIVNSENEIYLPYYAPLQNIDYKREGKYYRQNEFRYPVIVVSDLSRMPTVRERAIAKEAGLVIKTKSFFEAGGVLSFVFALLLGSFFVFNILYILNYIDKVNVKKFTVMKIVGAKPSFLIWATYLEVMIVALVGMGIGMGIEDAMFKSMSWNAIDKLAWVGYVYEVVITALTVFVATTVRVIRRGRSARIDRRSL